MPRGYSQAHTDAWSRFGSINTCSVLCGLEDSHVPCWIFLWIKFLWWYLKLLLFALELPQLTMCQNTMPCPVGIICFTESATLQCQIGWLYACIHTHGCDLASYYIMYGTTPCVWVFGLVKTIPCLSMKRSTPTQSINQKVVGLGDCNPSKLVFAISMSLVFLANVSLVSCLICCIVTWAASGWMASSECPSILGGRLPPMACPLLPPRGIDDGDMESLVVSISDTSGLVSWRPRAAFCLSQRGLYLGGTGLANAWYQFLQNPTL